MRAYWVYSVDSVSKIQSILSFIFHEIHGAVSLYVFSLPIYLVMIVRIRVLHLIIIIKSEVRPICDCWGLGHALYVLCSCVFLFLLPFAGINSKIEDLEDALINLSKLELSQLHTRNSKVSHVIHQVFGMLPVSDSNWRKAVVSPIV